MSAMNYGHHEVSAISAGYRCDQDGLSAHAGTNVLITSDFAADHLASNPRTDPIGQLRAVQCFTETKALIAG